jgi:hypothetical protein
MYLVESVADVAEAAGHRPDMLAYVTQTTLSVDDAARIVDALKAALPEHRRPEEGRHLLRHPEPPGRREVHGPECDLVHGGRLAQQLQLQPPAGSGRATGRAGLPGGQRRPLQAEWIAGQDPASA